MIGPFIYFLDKLWALNSDCSIAVLWACMIASVKPLKFKESLSLFSKVYFFLKIYKFYNNNKDKLYSWI